MGCTHSTPAPTEQDFLVEQKPPSSILCRTLLPKSRGATYDFQVNQKKNCWNIETPVNDLQQGMKLAPVDPSSKGAISTTTQCILFQDTEPLAVMRVTDFKTHKCTAHICSFTPYNAKQTSCGEHRGRSLFEWAVVAKRSESAQFTMTTAPDGICHATDYFGPVLYGPLKLVLKQKGLVCASLVEAPKWKCRVSPGIDPAMIVCFVACIDKLRENEAERLIAAQHSPQTRYKLSNVL
jgi:hypothetical protein